MYRWPSAEERESPCVFLTTSDLVKSFTIYKTPLTNLQKSLWMPQCLHASFWTEAQPLFCCSSSQNQPIINAWDQYNINTIQNRISFMLLVWSVQTVLFIIIQRISLPLAVVFPSWHNFVSLRLLAEPKELDQKILRQWLSPVSTDP